MCVKDDEDGTRNGKKNRFSTRDLILAMAPIDRVLQTLEYESTLRLKESSNIVGTYQTLSSALEQQDTLARTIMPLWRHQHGPSKRYLAKLLRRFIRRLECDGRMVESDDLAALLHDVLHMGDDDSHVDPDECCHLSYPVPPVGGTTSTTEAVQSLCVRIYPYNNDVSLRLWECGAVLAEYLLVNSHTVSNKTMVELGSGVGLTGLVAAMFGRHVYLTDYSEAALENIKYNFRRNEKWLVGARQRTHEASSEVQDAGSILSVIHLDWNECGDLDRMMASESGGQPPDATSALVTSSVLLAADVAYDVTCIPSLVRTLVFFFQHSSDPRMPGRSHTGHKKLALLAMTLRNMETFAALRNELSSHGIASDFVANGSDYNHADRQWFPTQFTQPRSHVQIFSLTKP